jgi:hypothetical protein
MLVANVTGEEKLWLLALSHGPLSVRTLKRRMSEALRRSLITKGLIRQTRDVLELTSEGAVQASEVFRAR